MGISSIIKQAKSIGVMQIDEEFAPFLQYLQKLKLKNFLEIGTSGGGCFFALSQVITGKAISIDLPNGPFGGIPFEAAVERNHKLKQLNERSHFLAENSQSLDTKKRVEKILSNDQLEFCFIDGDHTYQGVLIDYLLYSGLVKKGGAIAFHDIKDSPFHERANCHVSKLWSQLEEDKQEFVKSTEEWGGIGLIHV